jgi:hypothetical protein
VKFLFSLWIKEDFSIPTFFIKHKKGRPQESQPLSVRLLPQRFTLQFDERHQTAG